MICPLEQKLKSVIKYKPEAENLEYRQWLLNQFGGDEATNICTLEEFAVYFLNTLRQYTEVHFKTSGTETPISQSSVNVLKSNNNREGTARRLLLDASQQDTSTSNGKVALKNSHFKHNSNNKLDSYATTPELGTSTDRLAYTHNNLTSTPIRHNGSKNSRKLLTTPSSANKSGTSGLCLGDFMSIDTPTNNRSRKKKSTPTGLQNQQQKTAKTSQPEKAKKRLQPITVNKKIETSNYSFNSSGESSFNNENNILKISNAELDNKDQCAILGARRTLVLNCNEISKEIKNISIPTMPMVSDSITTSTPVKCTTPEEIPLDLKKFKNNQTLKRLAEIYALIITSNLTTNVLNELSFLLNLLNVPLLSTNDVITETCNNVNRLKLHENESVEEEEGLACLEHLPNAIYFALNSLALEKELLASLDTKSLGVVLINERFSYLPDDIKSYLLEVYQLKQQLVAEKPFSETSVCVDTKPCNNVYFRHEHDSRDHFSSHQEFINFRLQRDLFYNCLKIWESNHLNPMWNFSSEITPKIKEIFNVSENCINMAHLGKLFVSQLLVSTSNASSPEEIGLEVGLEKLSKLAQRLVAPSQFSVDYQFPRVEAFFRNFILEARSLAFAEQLKIELYTELTTQNDSSLDQIDISKAENDVEEQNASLMDYAASDSVIVRPDILSSMIILAKFLGFTMSLPYNLHSSNTMPMHVEKYQLKLRTLMQATLDVCVLLKQAIEQGKLLIVIPWLVQYFAMLDNVTLQLENYMKTLKLMFALFTYLGLDNPKPINTTSLFIIKLCLGWLFESKQFIADQYYNYRAILKSHISQDPENELEFIKYKFRHNIIEEVGKSQNAALNSYLECLLPIACPFLAEFRVSIMPPKYAQTKNASRTGRYRHITTRIAELPGTSKIKEDGSPLNSSANKSKQLIQNSLIKAFLLSQSTSTQQTIKFCIERCYKCVIKDGQLKILLPAKSNADNLANQIDSIVTYKLVYNSLKTIYDEAYFKVKTEWNDSIPKMLNKRINKVLEGLLPEETSSILKKTYFIIIETEAQIKISQWFYGNISEKFFCENLHEMTNKIYRGLINKPQAVTTKLTITKDTPAVSDLIDELQYWLHCTSVKVECFKDTKPLLRLFTNLIKGFENELPTLLYNLLGVGIIQLLQHIIAKHHHTHLSNDLIEAACQVWLHPNMKAALESMIYPDICPFDTLITIPFLESLGTKTTCFNQLTHLIVYMIKKQVVTVKYVNNIFLSIFKHEWHPSVLTEISTMLMTIAKETAGVPQKSGDNANGNNDDEEDIEKSNLFMDMLADLSRDVDF